MKKRTVWILIAVVVIVATTGLSLTLWGPGVQNSTKATIGRSVAVSRGDITVTSQATGKIEPNTITTLRPDPNLPTRPVVALLVKNGDRVKAGQVIAKLDASGLDLDLASAKANLDSQRSKLVTVQTAPLPQDLAAAQTTLLQSQLDFEAQKLSQERSKDLADQGLITQQQWEDTQRTTKEYFSKFQSAQAAFDAVKAGSRPEDIQAQRSAVSAAQSAWLKAQLILNSTTIKTPVDGIVSELLVNVGDLVTATTAVGTVSNIDPMIVRGYADEIDTTDIKVGQSAVVSLDSFPGVKIPGRVTEIDYRSIVQSNVTNFTILVSIPNPKGEYYWGMSATADITSTSLKNVLVVPAAAVRTSPGRTQVFLIDGDQTYLWDVQAGASDGVNLEMKAGLAEGQEILAAAPKAAPRTGSNPNPIPGGANPASQLLRSLR